MKIKVLNQIKENVKIPRWKLNSSMNIKCSCKSFLMQTDVVIPGAYCTFSTGRSCRFDLFYAGEMIGYSKNPRVLTEPLQADPCT